MERIAFCGFGAFNTAFAAYFDRVKLADMRCWDIRQEIREYMHTHNRHPFHFPDITFSSRMDAATNLQDLLEGRQYVILGVPAQEIRRASRELAPYYHGQTMIIVSKGLELGTNKRLSQVVEEELRDARVAVFAGGTVAADIVRGVPLIAEVASTDATTRERVADLFHSTTLRMYTNPDIISVELASALKNVVSLGAGICEGLGYEIGTQASFITRATRDIYKIAKALGANDDTFLPGSASVWGDIMLSSFGPTRNREYGRRICADKPVEVLQRMQEEHKTVEGYYTIQAAKRITDENHIDAPCVDAIYRIVYLNESPSDVLRHLLCRSRGSINRVV
ncbi:MAG: hypothetical protein V1725_03415 [archaeon]